MSQTLKLDKNSVILGFNRAAKSYDQAAFLQQEIGSRLIERLKWVKNEPKMILDLGSGTGFCTQLLKQHYPKASIFALDFAESMLIEAKSKLNAENGLFSVNRWKKQTINYICADAEYLPIQDNSLDLIFSNLSIQWCENYELLFREFARVLKPNAFIQFATFGVDTLHELKQSWAAVDKDAHVNEFVDMHDLGDMMLASGLADPLVDAEHITIEYTKVIDLIKDLKLIGAQNHLSERQKGLIGKDKFKQMLAAYDQHKLENNKYPATYEVIYGHAWAKDLTNQTPKKQQSSEQLVNFPSYHPL